MGGICHAKRRPAWQRRSKSQIVALFGHDLPPKRVGDFPGKLKAGGPVQVRRRRQIAGGPKLNSTVTGLAAKGKRLLKESSQTAFER
jgi:hypothetical protein